jgi:HKD family nuclease
MQIEVLPQVELGGIHRVRIGDVLNATIAAEHCQRLRFAVAYMRVSGLDRLSASIEMLRNRNGRVSGAVGIDERITTLEALEMLRRLSTDSTIFHTVSGYIYHPKLYLMEGERSADAIVGSANLTRDGLFRNVEFATVVHLDFHLSVDFDVYQRYNAVLNELLNPANPNVQPISDATLQVLSQRGAIGREAQTQEPGTALRSKRARPQIALDDLFPPMRVPVAPPAAKAPIVVPPAITGGGSLFIMQLSAFDSSHKTGVSGTPEVLIPHAAINFFPPLSMQGRRYPDTYFDVVLNTPTGRERHQYRLWYYEERAIGTRIDEYRLRLNHDTIDLSSTGGGDLLVINRLPEGSDPAYEVTILPQTDPSFPAFFELCRYEAQGKKWGGA